MLAAICVRVVGLEVTVVAASEDAMLPVVDSRAACAGVAQE